MSIATSSAENSFVRLLKMADFLTVSCVWWFSYLIRFKIFEGQSGLFLQFFLAYFLLLILTFYFFSRFEIYNLEKVEEKTQQSLDILKANIYTQVFFIVILYFINENRLSRLLLLSYFLLSTFLFVFHRLGLKIWFLKLSKIQPKKILVVGSSQSLFEYLDVALIRSSFPSEILAWVNPFTDLPEKYQKFITQMKLSEAREKMNPDIILIGARAQEFPLIDQMIADNYNHIIPMTVLPDLPYAYAGYHLTSLSGIPLMKLNQPHFHPVDLLLKRVFDISSTGVGLLILSPLLVVLAILVKASSPGPIFFGQERIGLDGKKFKMWKFRSMKVSAESVSTWTVKDDPRRTKFGTFIRKTSLDELPQLWNVFVGDMSLVGPRPEQPQYVQKFTSQIAGYMLRHKMKAGITGWAQVNGWRGDTSLEKRIECDLYYIRHWSFWFDIKILFLTFWKGFINKNAY